MPALAGQFRPSTARSVSNRLQLGVTVLGSARCAEFLADTGRRRAVRRMAHPGVEALVVIGGSDSPTGARCLSAMGFPVVGVASTIDHDLVGGDLTIGVVTTLNVTPEAIDRLLARTRAPVW